MLSGAVYKFFTVFGLGMVWMLPFIASIIVLAEKNLALGPALVIFFLILGGTIFVSVAQGIFQNKFIFNLATIPDTDTVVNF